MTFLSSHYRSPVDYTDAKIEEAKKSKDRILTFFAELDRLAIDCEKDEDEASDVYSEFVVKFEKAMDDDFNTPVALSVFFEALHEGNRLLSSKEYVKARGIEKFLQKYSNIFSLDLKAPDMGTVDTETIEKMITKRNEARKNKDFNLADELRDELDKMGILIKDTLEGTTWRKK